MNRPECFLAQFSNVPCDGRLVRVHLIAKQALRRRGHDPWDERAWVWACGGMVGLGGHHGLLDGYKLRIPPESVPEAVVELATELGMGFYLERRYGWQRAIVGRS